MMIKNKRSLLMRLIMGFFGLALLAPEMAQANDVKCAPCSMVACLCVRIHNDRAAPIVLTKFDVLYVDGEEPAPVTYPPRSIIPGNSAFGLAGHLVKNENDYFDLDFSYRNMNGVPANPCAFTAYMWDSPDLCGLDQPLPPDNICKVSKGTGDDPKTCYIDVDMVSEGKEKAR